jgi:lipopolysaccharide/colanic/teichoic acid biosynthesis glycosyltransferase
MYKKYFKRLFDVAFAGLLLVVFSPIMVIIFLVLLVINNGKPIYLQERAGKDENPFILLKFKTMTDLCDANGRLAEDSVRLTSFGRMLRKTSFDELPQLINVLKGDMSLIGPRPLFVKYLPYYDPTEKKRHQLRPGISGWAQVNGRNLSVWDKRLALDAYYVDNVSFKLDIIILFKTIINILSAKDVMVDETSSIADLDEERKFMNEYKTANKSALLQ